MPVRARPRTASRSSVVCAVAGRRPRRTRAARSGGPCPQLTSGRGDGLACEAERRFAFHGRKTAAVPRTEPSASRLGRPCLWAAWAHRSTVGFRPSNRGRIPSVVLRFYWADGFRPRNRGRIPPVESRGFRPGIGAGLSTATVGSLARASAADPVVRRSLWTLGKLLMPSRIGRGRGRGCPAVNPADERRIGKST